MFKWYTSRVRNTTRKTIIRLGLAPLYVLYRFTGEKETEAKVERFFNMISFWAWGQVKISLITKLSTIVTSKSKYHPISITSIFRLRKQYT